MTIDWLGRAKLQRIEALEREVARLRETIDHQPPPEDRRVDRIVPALTDLERRVAAAEDRAVENAGLIAEQAAALLSDAERAEADRTALAELRMALIRLERELIRQEDETRKIAAGLLDRIHRSRSRREDGEQSPHS